MTVTCEFWLPMKPKRIRPESEQTAGTTKTPEKVLAELPTHCEKLQKPTHYEKMLNLFNTRLLDFQAKNALIFPGRYVLHVEKVSPLEISRDFVEPQISEDGQSAPSGCSILANLFGSQSPTDLLVVITPTALEHKAEAVVHGFDLVTMEHLGTTIMDDSEWELIEQTHDSSNFQVIFCSSYIALEDVSEPTLIRETLQDLQQQAFKEIQIVPYDETLLSLYYRRGPAQDKTKETTSESSESSDELNTSTTSGTFTLWPFKGHDPTKLSQALHMASRLARQKNKFKCNRSKSVRLPTPPYKNPIQWPPAKIMHAVEDLRKNLAIELHSQKMYNRERKWNSCFSQNSKRRNIFI